MSINVEKIRKDFPILSRKINGHSLVYLDNVATTQKPLQVINAESDYYKNSNANIHRGAYTLSLESSQIYENAKKKTAEFIGANSWEEIIFTRNTTESINLVAHSLAKSNKLKSGSGVLSTQMEHHSNIVPWMERERYSKTRTWFVNVTKNGELDYDDFDKQLKKRKPVLVSVTHISNVLGTINDVEYIVNEAHKVGALVLIDGAQAAPHIALNLKKLDADFYAFSGHKMLAPFGIGVLYGKQQLLDSIYPFMVGGDMIESVTFSGATWNKTPWKFEAGTPNIGGAVALSSAMDYLENIGLDNVHSHEQKIIKYAMEEISKIDGAKIYGPAWDKRGGLVAFNLEGIHPHDISSVLDSIGVALRSGNHCAQPLMSVLKIPGSCRVGFYIYNDKEEVDVLISGLKKAQKIFA